MTDSKTEEVKAAIDYQTLADFLESTPPNQLVSISNLSEFRAPNPMESLNHKRNVMRTPEIQLHCDHESCNGARFFRYIPREKHLLNSENHKFIYLTYRCCNCQRVEKTFAISAKIAVDKEPQGECYKFGELPAYGPPVSPKLIKLIGPKREDFLKGMRSENQGLGVGAFAYYRRVVEDQKDRIITKIIAVSEKIGAPDERLDTLRAALKERQFSKALDMAKDALPESLLINGHSPIAALHDVLSDGIHALDDERCLELARSVRIVLAEIAERLSQALKDEAELTNALSTLMNRKE